MGVMSGSNKAEGYRRLVQHDGPPVAVWRRVTQQGVILYVMDGPCRLPWLTIPLALVWGCSAASVWQFQLLLGMTIVTK
jgi:hypothetical protein